MTRQTQEEPVSVPKLARQAGETRARWQWVEAEAWTERMLEALENGVKGGKWFSLMDKVFSLRVLEKAFRKVSANDGAPGVDHVTTKMFEQNLESNLKALSERLKTGQYRAQAIRRAYIPKAGSPEGRPLGIPSVIDRVVQTAVRMVIEPIFEQGFTERSYGFRPNRGCKDALREVERLLGEGYSHVVDADLRSYFDTIPQEPLMRRVEEKIADGKVLDLIRMFLRQPVMEGLALWTPEAGAPQGVVISPLLSNIYLHPLDEKMASAGFKMVRYADDFVVLCRTAQEAEQALKQVQDWTQQAGLTLHPEKTHLVDARTSKDGFTFLGYRFRRGYKDVGRKSLNKVKDSVREITPRNSGRSLAEVISRLNRTLRGWFEYFKQAHRSGHDHLDGWIRMRLRCILQKRSGRRGRGYIASNIRWPNAFFAANGLYSCATARDAACQSLTR